MEFVSTDNNRPAFGRLLLIGTTVFICASCAQTGVNPGSTRAPSAQVTIADSANIQTQSQTPETRLANTAGGATTAARSGQYAGFSLEGPVHIPAKTHSAANVHEFDIVRTDDNGTVTFTPAQGPITADTFVPTRTIRVTGSYYPIGIYGEPHSYATLIMRVPPGTMLPLIETSGEWLSVSTEKGVGFIRRTDAIISDTPIQTPSVTG